MSPKPTGKGPQMKASLLFLLIGVIVAGSAAANAYPSFFGRTHADLGRNFDLAKPGAFRDFDLRRPGTYKVRWFYQTDPAEGVWHGKLISNEVTFEIR